MEMTVHVNLHADDSDVTTATDGVETVIVATVEQNGAESTEPDQKSESSPQNGNTLNGGMCAYM